MLGGGYSSDSDSQAEKADGAEEGEEEVPIAGESEEEEASEASGEAARAAKLPSVKSAFASLGEDGLEFKKFAAAKAKARRVRAHEESVSGPERVIAASASSLRSGGHKVSREEDVATAMAAAEGGTKRPADEKADEGKGKGKGKDKDGHMTHKERTKLKRFKGQSGEDHSGRMWKPESWMKIRQEFD
eukprot:TRINITY_DN20180_c0_g4_i2.p3 TRINITY_DN20180_c0_g4~~TRINITY_DN20180_c0_g4_i2.p3  ORF type:complete len:188 (-),score=67.04 TRINITY_DN20180_c0_g4_i2:1738-2301(-)